MNVFVYTLMCYGLTIVISFLVVGMIVLINKVVSAAERKGGNEHE